MAVITDSDYLANNEPCVRAAMLYLGGKHAEISIPLLIKLLGYRDKPGDSARHGIYDPYTATDALYMIGKPAVPALIRTVEENENDTVESKNALYSLMSIYRGEPGAGIQALTKASGEQDDPTVSHRLHKAAEDARAQWCKEAACD